MGSLLSKATAVINEKKEAAMGSNTPTAFQHFAKAQEKFEPPLIANNNAFLGDVFSSQELSPSTPISAGFYRLAPGPELVYEYTYDEMKIIIDGHFEISDETGQKVMAGKGDVFFFPKGAKITFRTEEGGLAWYCGQRKKDTA